jgi:hypothetical protein
VRYAQSCAVWWVVSRFVGYVRQELGCVLWMRRETGHGVLDLLDLAGLLRSKYGVLAVGLIRTVDVPHFPVEITQFSPQVLGVYSLCS